MEKIKKIDEITCIYESTVNLILKTLENEGVSVEVSGVNGLKMYIRIYKKIQ